jgi:hypothetical protein
VGGDLDNPISTKFLGIPGNYRDDLTRSEIFQSLAGPPKILHALPLRFDQSIKAPNTHRHACKLI